MLVVSWLNSNSLRLLVGEERSLEGSRKKGSGGDQGRHLGGSQGPHLPQPARLAVVPLYIYGPVPLYRCTAGTHPLSLPSPAVHLASLAICDCCSPVGPLMCSRGAPAFCIFSSRQPVTQSLNHLSILSSQPVMR